MRLTWISTFLNWQFRLRTQSVKFGNGQTLRKEPSNFARAQSTSTRWLIILTGEMFESELPERLLMFVGAVLAWGIIADASSLAAWIGILEELANIAESTHALPGGKECLCLALWADEAVKKLLGVGDIDIQARAVIPIIAATIAVDHHAMIIWTTADAIFASVVAIFFGRGAGLGSRSQAGASRAGRGIGGVCKRKV